MKHDSEISPLESVDVILTSYNEEKEEVRRTIQSLLQQSIPVNNIFVIDDGSDPVLDISDMFTTDTCIQLIRNAHNIGISKSRNKALSFSGAAYIICMNVEVELKPEWLFYTLNSLMNNNSIGCVFTRITPFKNSMYSKWRFRFQEQKQPEESGAFFMASGHAVLFRRADLLKAGGYNPSLKRIGEDFQMSRALKELGLDTYYIHRPLAVSYQKDNLSSLAKKQLIRLVGNNPGGYNWKSFFVIITKDFLNRFFRNIFKLRWHFLYIDLGIFFKLLGYCLSGKYK